MTQSVKQEFEPNRIFSIETGKLAQQANGAVIVRVGDTMVLASSVAADTPRPGIDFFPLLVDFEEKLYAVGRIPGGFFKREGKPTETAILTARRIDRPIRPLFPKGYYNDVQIVITPLSVDMETPPDVLAINAASAALSISDIPFDGPVGAVRIGKIDWKLVVDPTIEQMQKSSLDLVIAGTSDAISMIECGAEQVSEADVMEGIKLAHEKIKKIIDLQKELMKKVGKKKMEPELRLPDEKIEKFVIQNAEKQIVSALEIDDSEKRSNQISKITEELENQLKKENDDFQALVKEKPHDIKNIMESIQKKTVRKLILEKNKRCGKRGLEEIRQLACEVGFLPRAHGSAIFSRGETQVLTVATLGALGEEQKLDSISPEDSKRYMHHYNFPAYSVGEVRPQRGPGRREIGHGALAEKALAPVIPSEEEFPYTIRLVSEVLGSNGSTSMASTCGSTLALMDAGVKIKAPVAGISIGLVKEGNKEILFTDIQGIEDFFGDMDFKVAGTKDGITAIQVDCKLKGLSLAIIEKALLMAKQARMKILDVMLAAIAKPRTDLSPYAPRVISFMIDKEKIGAVIGPGGKNIRRIIEETGVQIDIEDDGTVLITTADSDAAKRAKAEIDLVTFEPKVGDVFKAKVERIMNFGAFCSLPGGKDGLVHISKLADRRVAKVEDVVKIGDEVIVKVDEIDDMGRINLTIRGVTEEDKKRAI